MSKKVTHYVLSVFLLAAMLLTVHSCKKDDEKDPPVVTTREVTQITASGAASGGTVMSDGGSAIEARGVVWSTNPNPTISDSKTNDNPGVGHFTSLITGLTPDTKYYVRAYATNEAGTSYGDQLEFTTTPGTDPPTVTTTAVTGLSDDSAISGGEVVSDGGAPVTARGVVWATTENPTIDNNKTEDGEGVGVFVSQLTGLNDETTYYVRAYAINEEGVGYGEQITLTTWKKNTMVDAQGNVYPTVVLGNRVWMAKNLRTTIFNNGDPIPGPNHDADWVAAGDKGEPSWATFKIGRPGADGITTDEQMIELYGAIYNWFVAVDPRGVCPVGWIVPDLSDFTELRNYVIDNYDDVTTENVGDALKGARQIDHPWGAPYATDEHPRWRADGTFYGTDRVGFNAHAPGTLSATTGASSWIGRDAGYWTSVDHELDDRAYFRRLQSETGVLGNFYGSPKTGHGIRCVKRLED